MSKPATPKVRAALAYLTKGTATGRDLASYSEAGIKRLVSLAKQLERRLNEIESMNEYAWLAKISEKLIESGCKPDGILDSLDVLIRERNESLEKQCQQLERFRLVVESEWPPDQAKAIMDAIQK